MPRHYFIITPDIDYCHYFRHLIIAIILPLSSLIRHFHAITIIRFISFDYTLFRFHFRYYFD
jgi:hypothetical protein